MNIGYADFRLLCGVDDAEEWVPWMSVRGDGVYVKVPPAGLLASEAAALSAHPTGNLSEPALRFPCTLSELQVFLEESADFDCIDAFVMAKWVQDHTKKRDKVGAPIGGTERTTLLVIIAALCRSASINTRDRGAAGRIAALTDELGAPVSEDTLRRVLAQIPDALESRMK
ncbi:hypothetical protein [Accumulibacter sp.]|uniref:hypothetical protein n=1 Tax=Accumulibacter sp. TaxID=2053492 RepID=UPI0025E93A14|nr:hypothetical protein [Accumulibacter sp.]MCM8625502.1 hypothetical protein [Accumulibacter sp.]